MISTELEQLYIRCMNCAVPDGTCSGVRRDWEEGCPPRGFSPGLAPVELLIVAKNPGHPFEHEKQALAGKRGRELYEAFMGMKARMFTDARGKDRKSTAFARRLQEYLCAILNLPEAEVDAKVASTNLVKCSTKGEQDRLTEIAMKMCYREYLKQEIAIYRPKALLALGREVEMFLNQVQADHGLEVLYVHHPSWPMANRGKAGKLAELRRRYQEACQRAAAAS